MFCRSCGNKLADNAKFCNMCGSKIGVPMQPTEPEPVQPQTVIPEQPQEDNGFFQREQPVYKPYEPAYQEPIAQPFQSAAAGSSAPSEPGKFGALAIPAALMFLLTGFLISAPFFHLFGRKEYSFGAFSYFRDVAKLSGKNVFTATFDMISDGPTDTKLMMISLWALWIFEICALIFLLLGLSKLLSQRSDRAVKFFSYIRLSASLSFFGILASVGLMVASYLTYGKGSGVFSNVFYVWSYVFLSLALLTLILSIVFAVKSKGTAEVNNSYQQPAGYPKSPFM